MQKVHEDGSEMLRRDDEGAAISSTANANARGIRIWKGGFMVRDNIQDFEYR